MAHFKKRFTTTNATKEWRRIKVVFGIPSVILVLGVLFSQSLIGVLTARLTFLGDVIWLSLVGAVALYAFLRYRRSYLASAKRMATRVIDGSTGRLDSKRALICVIGLESGRATSPLALLLSQLPHLDYLVLLGTPESKALGVSSVITHELLASAGFVLPPSHVLISEQGDSYSMEDFDLAARQAVSWLTNKGVALNEIVCDITAGKRAMGFGVLLAADRTGVEVQYRDSNWDHHAKSHVPGRLIWKTVSERDAHLTEAETTPAPATL
jgi:hypothetical protein